MSGGRVKTFRQKKKNITRDVAEGLILSSLNRDGIFVLDTKAKTVTVDARRNHLIELYKEESYEDVIGIINKTIRGLESTGFTVTVKRLELV